MVDRRTSRLLPRSQLSRSLGLCASLLAVGGCGSTSSTPPPAATGTAATAQAMPAASGAANEIVDRYLSLTQGAFAHNDLTGLAQAVFVGGGAYQVDRSIIESLKAKGWHRERSYRRVGPAVVVHSGPYGVVVRSTINVDRDTDVSGAGQSSARFPAQTLQIDYTFGTEGEGGSLRLDEACLAATSTNAAPSSYPTPVVSAGNGTAGPTAPAGPTSLPARSSGAHPTAPPMAGPCNMSGFPF